MVPYPFTGDLGFGYMANSAQSCPGVELGDSLVSRSWKSRVYGENRRQNRVLKPQKDRFLLKLRFPESTFGDDDGRSLESPAAEGFQGSKNIHGDGYAITHDTSHDP